MNVSDWTGKKGVRIGLALMALSAATVPASRLLADTTDVTAAAKDHAEASKLDTARISAGRELFNGWSCNACHSLADAQASGAVGPPLDGDANLTEDFIVGRVTNGQGAMPAFGGQLTKEEIADLAYYLTKVSAK